MRSVARPVRDRAIDRVAAIAAARGVSRAQVGLAWVASKPMVTAPIVGARTSAQLKAALGTDELTLPAEITDALDDVSGGD